MQTRVPLLFDIAVLCLAKLSRTPVPSMPVELEPTIQMRAATMQAPHVVAMKTAPLQDRRAARILSRQATRGSTKEASCIPHCGEGHDDGHGQRQHQRSVLQQPARQCSRDSTPLGIRVAESSTRPYAFGRTIRCGSTTRSKVFSSIHPVLKAACFKVVPWSSAWCAILAALS